MSSLVYSCSTYNENHLTDADYASERKELKGNYTKSSAPHIAFPKNIHSAMGNPKELETSLSQRHWSSCPIGTSGPLWVLD